MTLKAPQNDRLNLSFVKDFFVVAKKWPEMVIKLPFMSHKFSFFFSYKIEKTETKKNVFYLIVFDPIKIDTHLAPKNVHQNINFVKDINLVCKKMTRNCHKIVPKPICALHFQYVFMKRKMRLHNNFDLFFLTFSWFPKYVLHHFWRNLLF